MDSYKNSIFEPLEYYRDHAKADHKQNVSDHFELLVKKSGIDIQKNKETVSQYRAKKKEIELLNKKLTSRKIIRAASIVISVIILMLSFTLPSGSNGNSAEILFPIFALFIGASIIFLTFTLTKKSIKNKKTLAKI